MDVGKTGNAAASVQSAYGTGQSGQTQEVRKSNVSGKTVGQPKLSDKAKKYYEELKARYHNMDFVLVSSDMKETAKANAASFANPGKMVVLVDDEKIERMAEDESYRKQYEGLIASAQMNMPKLKEAFGNSDDVKGYGMQVGDNGTATFFAVMKKSSDQMSAKLQEKRAEKKAQQKEAEKKAEKKEQEEKLQEKRAEKAEESKAEETEPEFRDLFGEYKNQDVEIVFASSVEDLVRRVEEYQFAAKSDSIKTPAELMVGQTIDFRG